MRLSPANHVTIMIPAMRIYPPYPEPNLYFCFCSFSLTKACETLHRSIKYVFINMYRLHSESGFYLNKLCRAISDRSVGSEGNRRATRFFERTVSSLGWRTENSELSVIDWRDGGASLRAGNLGFEVYASPYSLGCSVEAPLARISNIDELKEKRVKGKIILLSGEIANEQLMPKNFVFYNPEEHKEIIALLEAKQPAAIITATGRNASLAGGAYPFPLIEDGDFDIPSVYMTDKEGERLLRLEGMPVILESKSERIPSKAYNITARKGASDDRIVLTAHIDAKKGTPGAIDNATGVVCLLLLAELLSDYEGGKTLEIAALNGEDYYAVPGQMDYIRMNRNSFGNIRLNINIDGAGYREGKTVFSMFDLSSDMREKIDEVMNEFKDITEGIRWPQGDHSIFIQQGCPAIAVSSQWFTEHMESQEITHTPKDSAEIVDLRKVVEIAQALNRFIRKI